MGPVEKDMGPEVDIKVFQVSIDANDIRRMFTKYGQGAVDAVIDKVTSDLKHKIKSALKLDQQTGIAKPLVEAIR
jgi:hypothetical protein